MTVSDGLGFGQKTRKPNLFFPDKRLVLYIVGLLCFILDSSHGGDILLVIKSSRDFSFLRGSFLLKRIYQRMACTGRQLWWFRFTCFFFFGGLACFIPFLTPHLRWLGLNLREISAIHLISGILSTFGLLLAAASSSHRGHRICLAIGLLLAAFCGGALVFVPRLQGRAADLEGPPPVAEVLCSPEGSVLFFRKCGSSCDLDGAGRLELQVSDCKFEPRTKISTNWKALIGEFNFLTPFPEGNADLSEPERGDLPEKIGNNQEHVKDGSQQLTNNEEPNPTEDQQQILDQFSDNYDYEENHKQANKDQQTTKKQKFQNVDPVKGNDDYYYDPEPESKIGRKKRQSFDQDEFPEFDTDETEIPYNFQPHLCFETGPQSKLCHVFTKTEHSFRMQSAFRTGISKDSSCFYPLLHSDNEYHLLSEVHCRLHRDDLQVRCKAEGIDLRARVAHNGSDICSEDPGNFHVTFWIYLILRTLAEIGVIATLILLFMIALDCKQRELLERVSSQQKKSQILGCWWLWAALGAILFGPAGGVLCHFSSFYAVFLLGAVLFGLAAFMIALAPYQDDEQQKEEKEDQFQNGEPVLCIQHFWICRKLLGKILSSKRAFWILALMVLYGTAVGHVHTTFYWFLMDLKTSSILLGVTMATAVIFTGAIFPAKTWLFIRCGHNYIFMIGLLLYAIRFFGYSLINWTIPLVILELLEALCSCWMLVTALIAIGTMESPTRNNYRWQVNAWALVIVFHYSIGRGLGSLYSGLFSYYFNPGNVFVGTGIVFVLGAALWLLLYLTVAKQQRKYKVHSNPGKQSKGITASKPDKQQSEPAYTQLDKQEAKKQNLKN